MIAPTDSGSWITSLSTSASTFLETLRMSKRLSLDTAGTTAFAKWLFVKDFTPALLVRESDTLLLAIAEQYYKAKELNAAEQYLFRIVKNSDNEDIIIKSENLLGNIYIDKEDYDAAQTEFDNVLKKNENSADAHYGIGVIYEKQGNIVKARSEWRKALKIQVNHPGALQKMSEN